MDRRFNGPFSLTNYRLLHASGLIKMTSRLFSVFGEISLKFADSGADADCIR